MDLKDKAAILHVLVTLGWAQLAYQRVVSWNRDYGTLNACGGDYPCIGFDPSKIVLSIRGALGSVAGVQTGPVGALLGADKDFWNRAFKVTTTNLETGAARIRTYGGFYDEDPVTGLFYDANNDASEAAFVEAGSADVARIARGATVIAFALQALDIANQAQYGEAAWTGRLYRDAGDDAAAYAGTELCIAATGVETVGLGILGCLAVGGLASLWIDNAFTSPNTPAVPRSVSAAPAPKP